MNVSPNQLIITLENNGSKFKRSKGSHRINYNSASNKTVTVPLHGKKDFEKRRFFRHFEIPWNT